MLPYAPLLREFTAGCRAILGGELVGIYLHGSAAMGCFRAAVSDLDLLAVVGSPLSRRTKTDRDLAAHFMMTLHRGRRLWGKEISAVFSDVPPAAFWDSLRNDLSDCETVILTQPVYVILNLCRALAYREAGLFLSKEEGGAWALAHLSAPDAKALVAQALAAYAGEGSMAPEEQSAAAFARTMLCRLDGR